MKTFGLSLFLAVLGFSYALATRSDSAPASRSVKSLQVSPRSVGQTLRFTNPFLGSGIDPAYTSGGDTPNDPKGFDLGDGCVGQPFTRYLTGAGGFMPYTYEIKPNFDFIGSQDVAPMPKLYLNGRISDTFDTPLNGAARFNAVLSDYLGTQRTGTFRMNLFASPSEFRFAQDKLPTAQLGNSFFANLETLSPVGQVRFSLRGLVTAGGAPYARLEEIGLSMTSDGIIYGRPSFAAGTNSTITFAVRATDSLGNIAMSRSGLVQDQVFVVKVESNSMATSEVVGLHSQLNATAATFNQDTFQFTGSFDPKGLTTSSLAGSLFTLRINGAIYSGTFDGDGKVFVAMPGKNKALKVTVNPGSSLIQINLSGATLYSTVNPNGVEGKITLPVIMNMEFKHYRTSEALEFQGRDMGSKMVLVYGLGGARGKSFAGGFQIIRVHGTDRTLASDTAGDPGSDGDIWSVTFIGVPRFAIDSGAAAAFPVRDPKLGAMQTGSVSATIRIGEFSQQVTAKINSNRLRFKVTLADAGLYEVLLDGEHFVHSVLTNTLIEDDTAILQAIKNKNPTIFRFGLDVTGYSGETGRVMAPNQGQWIQR